MKPVEMPKPGAGGPFTSNAAVAVRLAQREASERGHGRVRPIHVLVAAARMEKTISGYVFEKVGVTPHRLSAFLDTLGTEETAPRPDKLGPAFAPATIALLNEAGALVTRWRHNVIGNEQLTGALAESEDPEVKGAFAYCETSGEAVMEVLMERMREVGLI